MCNITLVVIGLHECCEYEMSFVVAIYLIPWNQYWPAPSFHKNVDNGAAPCMSPYSPTLPIDNCSKLTLKQNREIWFLSEVFCLSQFLCRFRSELDENIQLLTPKLSAVAAACERVIDSQSLTGFLAFTLQTCNFINAVLTIQTQSSLGHAVVQPINSLIIF